MKYTSQAKQLTIDDFKSSLEGLSKSNRWVQLGDSLPWAKIEKLYMLELPEFTDKPIFDPSLFVTIRKRIGEDVFNDMSVSLLERQIQLQEESEKKKDESKPEEEGEDDNQPQEPQEHSDTRHDFGSEFTDSNSRLHKGVLKIDATCCNAEVRYPVDVDIIHDGCRIISRYIAILCSQLKIKQPECNYKSARQEYLNLIKKKKKKASEVKIAKRMLLYYLNRDIQTFVKLISASTERFDLFMRKERNIVGSIIKMYHQQMEMLQEGTNQCANRIISIFQPHIRPIVRGKAKAKVEFGAKIGAGIVNGYTFVDHLSWDAYNEESDVELQIRLYKERFGYLPATVLCDKIYMNRANRQLFKEYEINSY